MRLEVGLVFFTFRQWRPRDCTKGNVSHLCRLNLPSAWLLQVKVGDEADPVNPLSLYSVAW